MQDSTSGEESKLDEAHNRIYLMPWNATELIVYGLHGNLLPSIPLNSPDEKPWKLPEAALRRSDRTPAMHQKVLRLVESIDAERDNIYLIIGKLKKR